MCESLDRHCPLCGPESSAALKTCGALSQKTCAWNLLYPGEILEGPYPSTGGLCGLKHRTIQSPDGGTVGIRPPGACCCSLTDSVPAFLQQTQHTKCLLSGAATQGFLYREEFSLGFKFTAPVLLEKIYYVCTCVYVYQ